MDRQAQRATRWWLQEPTAAQRFEAREHVMRILETQDAFRGTWCKLHGDEETYGRVIEPLRRNAEGAIEWACESCDTAALMRELVEAMVMLGWNLAAREGLRDDDFIREVRHQLDIDGSWLPFFRMDSASDAEELNRPGGQLDDEAEDA